MLAPSRRQVNAFTIGRGPAGPGTFGPASGRV